MNSSRGFLVGAVLVLCESMGTAGQLDSPDSSSLRFLPGIPRTPRLTAHVEEPRTGVRKTFGSSRLKLDIGAAYDVMEWHPGNDSTKSLRAGAEFFAYALSNNAYGLRLQIDAADGFFGGHLLYSRSSRERLTALRLRILHLSAHFLDGHSVAGGNGWRDGREPIPFTRDFGELTALWRTSTGRGHVQLYGGTSYATLSRPDALNRWTFLAGGEYVNSEIAGNLLGQLCNCYTALHFTLAGVPAWIGTTYVEGGVRFGGWDQAGLRIYLSYQAGLVPFHQYFNVREESWGGGIAFDLW